jgi:Fe2+ or Zn2+ uptake regulation protein
VGRAVEAGCREELRCAGLPGRGALARLLAILRATQPETHLSLGEVVRMAAASGLAAEPADVARQLETLADHGLLGRLPSTSAEPIFDTVPRPHSHLVYEEPAQIVDLDVSPETLLAIVRQALAERCDGVEILVRFRRHSRGDPAAAALARTEGASSGLRTARDGLGSQHRTALAAEAQAVGAGELSPEEVQAVAGVLKVQRKAIETAELERRIAALEQRQ